MALKVLNCSTNYESCYKAKLGKKLKILTAKQRLQVLRIAPAQVKAENLLNEIRQIIYSVHREKVYNNIVNSTKS